VIFCVSESEKKKKKIFFLSFCDFKDFLGFIFRNKNN
jgi:hypothetical protein